MFQVGDLIIYGNRGVCVVDTIGPLEMAGSSQDKLYYTLRSYYTEGSTFFTPVDNEKIIMRAVLTKEEALQMIDKIDDTDVLWIEDERKREQKYKDAIYRCSCTDLVRIIKTIYEREEARIAEGKKITATDERYFKIAEDTLYGELAIPLELSKEETHKFVVKHFKKES